MRTGRPFGVLFIFVWSIPRIWHTVAMNARHDQPAGEQAALAEIVRPISAADALLLARQVECLCLPRLEQRHRALVGRVMRVSGVGLIGAVEALLHLLQKAQTIRELALAD